MVFRASLLLARSGCACIVWSSCWSGRLLGRITPAASVCRGTEVSNWKQIQEQSMELVRMMIAGGGLVIVGGLLVYLLARRHGRELWCAKDGGNPYRRSAKKVPPEQSK